MTTNNTAPKPSAPKTEKDIPAQQVEETVTEVIVETVEATDEVDNSKLGKLKANLKKHRKAVIGVTAGVALTVFVIIKNINSTEDDADAEGTAEDSTS